MTIDFDSYTSPFSWRYSTPELRRIWSEKSKRRIWRQVWVALAQAQLDLGLVQLNQVQDLHQHIDQIDIPRALQIEAEIHHDLMAELRTFAEQCPVGGSILHLGATSMDIEDNADAIRLRQSTDLILSKLRDLLLAFAYQIESNAGIPIIAFTHLQPAEPSTLGYRLALYAQDLLADFERLKALRASIRGKGFKGSVGTAASYIELVGLEKFPAFENRLSELLDLSFFPVSSQTYPRKQDYDIVCALAGLGQSLYKFAFDLRLLQSPPIGELSEPFSAAQVGSSAMPFKRNPIQAEKINSLARLLSQMPMTAWNNAAHSLLERTLDDSANRRSLIPEAFLVTDECLITAIRIIKKININTFAIQHNLDTYAPFASTERLLMALVQAGANRQDMHEQLRQHAMEAWRIVQSGQPNPLVSDLAADLSLRQYLPADRITALLQVDNYTGIAAGEALHMVETIRAAV